MPISNTPKSFPGTEKLPELAQALLRNLFPPDEMPTVGMSTFPKGIPPLPKGHTLLNDLWGQIDKIRTGRSDDMKKLAELMPDYKPGKIDKYLHTNANVEPSAQAYFDRITEAALDKSIPEKVWQAIADGSQKLAVEDNATLEQIMRFLAD